MNTLIVGHRGVGKSELLKRIPQYLPDAIVFDLDAEIVKTQGQDISEIFKTFGEEKFRDFEKEILTKLVSENFDAFIAVGAGCDISFLPSEAIHILWLKRKTDLQERFFLNRPALKDYSKRIPQRERFYSQIYDEVLLLPEGMDFVNKYEEAFFTNKINAHGASLTLLPENFKSREKFNRFINKRKTWNLSYVEFRDDLLKHEWLEWVLEFKNYFKILYSFRKPEFTKAFPLIKSLNISTDWTTELGKAPGEVDFISSHSHLRPEGSGCYLKYSPEIKSFNELMKAHIWSNMSENNIFLPRGGKWHWYRLLMKDKFALNFIREGDGSSPEQPTLMQWLMTSNKYHTFSAVLGHPVEHSRSPVEHMDQEAFFDIDIEEDQWDEALDVLTKLGLTCAAVTAPLKEKAGSVNTLKLKNDVWEKTNTDLPALAECFLESKMSDFKKVSVWGGGGMLKNLKTLLPEAQYYSARTAMLREAASPTSPEVVIWASGSNPEYKNPPDTWRPQVIFDLNYSENSPGLEYAIKTGAKYISGLELFHKQAALQKVFWNS